MKIFLSRLLKTGRPAEALSVISALEDKPRSDEKVRQTFEAIRESVIIESMGPSSTRSGSSTPQKPVLETCLHQGDLRTFAALA